MARIRGFMCLLYCAFKFCVHEDPDRTDTADMHCNYNSALAYAYALTTRFRNMQLVMAVQMAGRLETMNSGRLYTLTITEEQEFSNVVHFALERGSIYFDTVKIYAEGPYSKG